MRRLFSILLPLVLACASGVIRAQENGLGVLQSIPHQPLAPGSPAVTIDLRNFFGVSGVDAAALLVQFDTTYGRFNVELHPEAAPRQVANFLSYVDAEAYANSVIHRSAAFDGGMTSIVQSGGYRNPPALAEIPRAASVPFEFNLPHARGSLAAARGEQPDSTTSEWFINARDNSAVLDPGTRVDEAGGPNRALASPRLINVSTLAQIEADADLTAGFVIGGQTARTVLVRGVGPSLTRLGVSVVMPDPILDLYNNNTGQRMGGNDDWAGALEVSATAALVGAFSLGGGTSKDAALLVTLSPGAYSARIRDATGTSGTAIIEVYEVP